MKIKLSYVTEKNFKNLPEWSSFPYSCKYCIYWEFPHAFKNKPKQEIKGEIEKKVQWLQNVRSEFGECAIMLSIDKKVIGYAQYAPPKFLPHTAHYPVLASPDAILISCLFIFHKKFRRQGFGTILLNAVVEDLEKKGMKAIEVIARKDNPDNPAGPVEFYLKNGFTIYKDDNQFPLMRFKL